MTTTAPHRHIFFNDDQHTFFYKKDGVHQRKESSEPVHTDAEVKLMYSQDQRYVNMKRVTELKVSQNTYRITAVLKVETDINTRIAASLMGQAKIW